ncbi:hypothetical protein L1987_66307 [Smallanthus sonchifolius]|uniref:Uncharacterized protein n=1 Tax=Smallanthus sonchifolius TaxID=185202 RepID=A0ACB9BX12_9ASTR|nr:hypothetical protein L1987_66307 [Smallanthus sonchifolius]
MFHLKPPRGDDLSDGDDDESYHGSEKPSYARTLSAPRLRSRDIDQQLKNDQRLKRREGRSRTPPSRRIALLEEAPFGLSIVLSIMHSVLINGDATNFEIDPSFGVEASELYPEIKYTTVDGYLAQLA